MHDVVVSPLISVQSFFAVAQDVAKGAGGDGAERALWVNHLLPLGQVVRAGKAVGRSSCSPSHHTLGN